MSRLDEPCPACGRPTSEHLVPEWLACVGRPWEDLPWEGTPAGLTFSLEGRDVVVADTLTCRSLVANPVGKMFVPVLLLTFSVGVPGAPPDQVAEVALVASSAEMMRKFAKLLADSARGAANAAEAAGRAR